MVAMNAELLVHIQYLFKQKTLFLYNLSNLQTRIFIHGFSWNFLILVELSRLVMFVYGKFFCRITTPSYKCCTSKASQTVCMFLLSRKVSQTVAMNSELLAHTQYLLD